MDKPKSVREVLEEFIEIDKIIPKLPSKPTQKEMIELAKRDIAIRRRGRYKLTYSKSNKTIVAVDRITTALTDIYSLLAEGVKDKTDEDMDLEITTYDYAESCRSGFNQANALWRKHLQGRLK